MERRILLIEDDLTIAKVLEETGRSLGAEVEVLTDGSEGLARAESTSFALVVLDVSLPGLNGFEVCRRLRELNKAVPILMITSHVELVDKVLGLELGADDYVTKPFSIREVSARMRLLIRRYEQLQEAFASNQTQSQQQRPAFLNFGSLEINLKRMEASINKTKLELTVLEFELLSYLATKSGVTVPRDELMRSVWGYNCTQFDATITTHMSRLRAKLETQPDKPRFISTIKGVGYRFVTEEELNDR